MGPTAEGRHWQPLECSVAVEGGRICVRTVGELDLATTPMLDERLREALDHEPRELEVDLSGLTFMDSSGLHLLLRWCRTTADRKIEFSVSGATRPVQRLFALAGVDKMLPLRPGREGDGD